jgi:pimeloyl-ACP methyl ester carboxylesterase
VTGLPRRRFLASAGALAAAACAGPDGLDPFAPKRESGYVDVDGGRLYYEAAGTGAPVVLLHAFALDTRMWEDQFEPLAREFRVIRYDLRGFGRSTVPQAGRAYSHADDLATLLAKLDAHRPHLVGASMGGRCVLDFAVTQPDAPRSVVVVDTVIGGWPWSREWLEMYSPVLRAGRSGDIAAARAAWTALPLFATVRANPPVDARFTRMVEAYSGWHFVNADPERRVAPPTLSQLGRIRAATLAMVGDKDLPEFQRMAETVARQVANARRLSVPAAGHLPSMESPELVTKALRASFARA